jgi:hypothetical protein
MAPEPGQQSDGQDVTQPHDSDVPVIQRRDPSER